MVDVGCGSGGLTVEAASRARKVIALDKNPEAINLTQKNLEKHGYLNNVHLREGEALKILEELESFQVLLVGSSGDLPSIVTKGWSKLTPREE